MWRRVSPIFLTLNVWGMDTPSGTDSNMKTGESIKILGWANPGCGKKNTAMSMTMSMILFFIIYNVTLNN
jgi:hypothetical protein